MNILEQVKDAKPRFVELNGREPEHIFVTKTSLLEVARLEKRSYYPNEILGIQVIIWSPTSGELERNGGAAFYLE